MYVYIYMGYILNLYIVLYNTAIHSPNFLWFFNAAPPSLLRGSGHQRHTWGNSTRPIANTRRVHQQVSQRHCLAQWLCFFASLDLKISWNFNSGSCAAESEARQQVEGRLLIKSKENVYIIYAPLKLEHALNQSCFPYNVHVHTDSAVLQSLFDDRQRLGGGLRNICQRE